jgi:hypothetical protein
MLHTANTGITEADQWRMNCKSYNRVELLVQIGKAVDNHWLVVSIGTGMTEIGFLVLFTFPVNWCLYQSDGYLLIGRWC